eukprot:PhF_6_TR41083/c0_g1_i1/m.62239
MLRRSLSQFRHHVTDADNTPIHMYSPFGWHYLNPGGINHPRTQNRNYGLVWNLHNKHGDHSIRIDISKIMHPAYFIALEPFLKQLAPDNANPQDVLKEYMRIAPRLPESERHALLAKVGGFCGDTKLYASLKPIWDRDGAPQYVQGNAVPSVELAIGITQAACASDSPDWKVLFDCGKKDKWNTTPHYPERLWGLMIRCAANSKDENGVMDILEEAFDCRANIDVIPPEDYVTAFNSIQGDAAYERMKKFLFHLSSPAAIRLRHKYVNMRMKEQIPLNDKIFYHVHWHQVIRQPMHFLPRRLYFDYTPSHASKLGGKPGNTDELVKQRVQQWKEEGLLPEDSEGLKINTKADFFYERHRKVGWIASKPKVQPWGTTSA